MLNSVKHCSKGWASNPMGSKQCMCTVQVCLLSHRVKLPAWPGPLVGSGRGVGRGARHLEALATWDNSKQKILKGQIQLVISWLNIPYREEIYRKMCHLDLMFYLFIIMAYIHIFLPVILQRCTISSFFCMCQIMCQINDIIISNVWHNKKSLKKGKEGIPMYVTFLFYPLTVPPHVPMGISSLK